LSWSPSRLADFLCTILLGVRVSSAAHDLIFFFNTTTGDTTHPAASASLLHQQHVYIT
jgi:hypothetical protein